MQRVTEAWLACVDIPSFTLQLLLREHPEWRRVPAVVVDADKPLGWVVAVNSSAAERGIRRGMRYATALSLVSTLQAGTVAPVARQEGVLSIISVLQRFSPAVEHASFDSQSFWVDIGGMERLFPDRAAWIKAVRAALKEIGFFATVAVGYGRFGTYIGAKLSKGVRVFSRREQEELAVVEAPIGLLPLDARSHARLEDLGVTTVGGFRAIAGNQVRRKLGEIAFHVHRFATTEDSVPLQPAEEISDLRFAKKLQTPLFTHEQLLHTVEELLDAALTHLEGHAATVRRLLLALRFEDDNFLETEVRPARPTRERKTLVRLLSLRLEGLSISAGIAEVILEPDWMVLELEAGELFSAHPSRNLEAGNKALAALRAELGEDAVCAAAVVDAHLPEERFIWRRFGALSAGAAATPPTAAAGRAPKVVRRILREPVQPAGAPQFRAGPYILDQGWWRHSGGGGEHRREYYYAEMNGELLWIYRDVRAEVWMIQGVVE
ncbi:MAG: Y-family DNA polymerase [Spirochaetota bacterium]